VFSARRGLEKTFFHLTIALSVLFFALTLAVVLVSKAAG
jgi:preprotein translocase subunit SecG